MSFNSSIKRATNLKSQTLILLYIHSQYQRLISPDTISQQIICLEMSKQVDTIEEYKLIKWLDNLQELV